MAADTPIPQAEEQAFDQALSATETALSQARNELAAMTDAASAANSMTDDSDAEYSIHMVDGIGRYVVVRKTGWRALIKAIQDAAADIDFSLKNYPNFDAVIYENFKSPYLADPLSNKYEEYKDLRDNIAAVRNFLMESYYVNSPPGMSPEKAKQAMAEIAAFVGKGLDNNYEFLGIIPNHRLGKTFISIDEASAPGGQGAQYIYEKILEMQRQSNWMRPFSAVLALFGGHTQPDWMLPPAHETEFTDLFSHDIVDETAPKGPPAEALENHIKNVEALEAKRAKLIDQHHINAVAHDLDVMGEQFLHSASNMQNVAHLSEPVRRDAIEIAKDILRKLRVSLGDIPIANGLNLPPKEDSSALGSLKGVVLIYERMIGWARSVDASILQHPSVVSGVQAIGQLGYLAKQEALRMAKTAGNESLAGEISAQIEKIPAAYRTTAGTKFAGLLDRIESGMNTMLTRIQTITGPTAQIGNSPSREVGQSISQPPTAGIAQQASNAPTKSDDAAMRNAQLLAAQNAQQQLHQNRQNQQAARNNVASNNNVWTTTSTTPPRGINSRTITTTTRTVTTRTINTTAPQNPSSRTSNTGANESARLARLQNEREDQEARQRADEMRRIAAQQQLKASAARAAAMKIDPNMLRGFQNATNTKGMGPVASAKKPVPPPAPPSPTKPPTTQTAPKPEDRINQPQTPQVPGRGGRGF